MLEARSTWDGQQAVAAVGETRGASRERAPVTDERVKKSDRPPEQPELGRIGEAAGTGHRAAGTRRGELIAALIRDYLSDSDQIPSGGPDYGTRRQPRTAKILMPVHYGDYNSQAVGPFRVGPVSA